MLSVDRSISQMLPLLGGSKVKQFRWGPLEVLRVPAVFQGYIQLITRSISGLCTLDTGIPGVHSDAPMLASTQYFGLLYCG